MNYQFLLQIAILLERICVRFPVNLESKLEHNFNLQNRAL